jgi:PhoH-like ATPase
MIKNFVLDTNVLLTDPKCIIDGFDENNLVIPLAVIEEVDSIKKESQNRGYQAREVFRILDQLLYESKDKNVRRGIVRNEQGGTISIVSITEDDVKELNDFNFAMDKKDDLIVLTALKCTKELKGKTIFVSNDTNARLKAIIHGLPTEIYKNSAIPADVIEYNGYRTVYLPLSFFGSIEDGKFIRRECQDALYLDDVGLEDGDIAPNEFVLLEMDPDEEHTDDLTNRDLKKLKKVYRYTEGALVYEDLKTGPLFGNLNGRNLEQSIGISTMMDPNIKVVTLKSPSGSGKTITALGCALTQVFDKESPYEKLILVKPTVPVAKDLGFLPGDVHSKLEPFMKSYTDNFEILKKMHTIGKGETVCAIEEMMEGGILEIEAISYIRGRSFNNAIILVDEVQNCDAGTMKTILSRVGQDTKIFCLGDVEQIDQSYLSKNNNGLSHLIKKFRGQEFYAHVTFLKCERSPVSEAASRLL